MLNNTNNNEKTVPYDWVSYRGFVPPNAVGVANEKFGRMFYVGRGEAGGGVHPGYFDPVQSRCYVCYDGKEVICEQFEILICDPTKYRWTPCKPPVHIDNNPIMAGYKNSITNLYVAKCVKKGTTYFGETYHGANCASYGLAGKEETTKDFEILTYA
ncbi:hypothetical protein H8356DRAFT_1630648 [Neocallimastix lanati (nom. inval.)]|uniref:Uncharacterized protein n=1 Tax=Neocallimastix californiae TaxID=1754190 RepID=A0A1Y2FPK6_9FUNG|nr:hypothetical protein H8356DRAFT_1630648 [Neocallimastix sp. JGI-2020a]ORY85913.1 hypothetical protein LY90DRAFT_394976 [Neocallimastix californiae]|eukprot:ORY85913.1 hypothetical protein LY90DRAFT_394976 [Neocallimastix californiae]